MEIETYSIQELSEKSGLPRRTIHFYIQQGLLPPPQGAGLGARYDQLHLTRLRLIPLLRQQGLRLDQIRTKFQQASMEDLAHIEEQATRTAAAPKPLVSEQAMAQLYTHYVLPGGIILAVPASIPPEERIKIQKLLDTAHQIFQE